MKSEVDRMLSMGIDAYNVGLSLADEFEKDDPKVAKQLGQPLKVQYRAELLSYLLYLSETAGGVDARRAEYINKVLGYDYSAEDFNELMRRLDLHGQDFAGMIPTTLKAAWNYDQKRGTQKSSQSIVRLIDRIGETFRIYSMSKDSLEEMDHRIYILALTNWLSSHGIQQSPSGERENLVLTPLLREEGEIAAGLPKEKDASKEETEIPKENLEDLMKQLNDLTGLEQVKEDVASLVNLLKIKKLRKERNFSDIDVSMHLVFTGNPGTGKTTVARLLSKIYHSLGALSKGQLVEVDRTELVGGYVGQTAIKTKEVTDSAKGGVLFIDEAYSLTSGKDKSDFGYEAVNTLLVEMENNRDDLAVIVAGYPEPMEEFLQSNPGLKSRFNKFIDFPDYKPEELYDIFEGMTSKAGYTMDEKAQEEAKKIFREMYERRDKDFANGRAVRNFFEKAMVRQANRLAEEAVISDEMLAALTIEDLKDQPKKDSKTVQENGSPLEGNSHSETAGQPHSKNPEPDTASADLEIKTQDKSKEAGKEKQNDRQSAEIEPENPKVPAIPES